MSRVGIAGIRIRGWVRVGGSQRGSRCSAWQRGGSSHEFVSGGCPRNWRRKNMHRGNCHPNDGKVSLRQKPVAAGGQEKELEYFSKRQYPARTVNTRGKSLYSAARIHVFALAVPDLQIDIRVGGALGHNT